MSHMVTKDTVSHSTNAMHTGESREKRTFLRSRGEIGEVNPLIWSLSSFFQLFSTKPKYRKLSQTRWKKKNINQKMPFFYSKRFGGRHISTGITVSRHGVRRQPWGFRLGKCLCFR
ncbi:hypothetical protein CPSG_09922 [Coccidioides posadasii str. Silveira]|uniref:Uncharacterized protein n=1 Tax=Coccidioides posadasii (strain RMSCC 757 / Silveira) TaxID=443226 RepID=E9DJC3_COCPS|nr:hypothetical protein CPSG_09922 [Coccidioides posadasii str. Silveira]